jgi:hypothetical protein
MILHGKGKRVEMPTRPPSLFQICPTNWSFLVETVVAVADGVVVVGGAAVVAVVVFATPF